MKETEIEKYIEAILFGAGDSVLVNDIAEAMELEPEVIIKATNSLAESYDKEKRGLRIIKLENSYQMCSREDYADVIQKIFEPRRKQALSPSALETLSIIAYNQPITKGRIEVIRGVDSSYSVSRLIERGFIEEAGRLDAPGKPILYITTEEFLRCFGLESLNDLPEIPEIPEMPEEEL